jgi:hypothetical protein
MSAPLAEQSVNMGHLAEGAVMLVSATPPEFGAVSLIAKESGPVLMLRCLNFPPGLRAEIEGNEVKLVWDFHTTRDWQAVPIGAPCLDQDTGLLFVRQPHMTRPPNLDDVRLAPYLRMHQP